MRVFRCLTYLLPLATMACGGSDLTLPDPQGPTQLLMVRGDRQEAVAGQLLPDPLVVRLVDTLGQPVAGGEVSWTVVAGGGSIVPTLDTTDAAGLATTRWILGPDPGANAVRAVVANVVFVTFTAVGTTGSGDLPQPSATRSTISADPGSIPVDSGTSTIAVTVKDDQGNPVEGATVSLEASGSGNSLTQPTATTDSNGLATGTLSSTDTGTKVVSATINGSVRLSRTAEVAVTAQGPAGSGVDHLVFRLQPHDINTNEQFRVEVALVDNQGNVVPLTGILIYLGLFEDGKDRPDNGRLAGERFRDTQDGVAVFDDLAVTTNGTYRIRALTDQLPELGPHGPEPYLFSIPFTVH